MTLGSRSRGCRSHTEAPSADNAPIAPQLNLEFDAHERRLSEAKAQIHRAGKTKMGSQAEIHALELNATNTEARARLDSGNKEAYGEEVDHEVVKDVIAARVIAGHKVPKEDAHGEDAEESHHRGSQEEQPARATKKARKEYEPCFHRMVLNALEEKQELLQQKWNEEAIAKEAAATASKPPYYCRCWCSHAPYMPSKSGAGKEDSNDGLSDS